MRDLRSERKLSLRDLGRQAGIAHSTLSRWEKGSHLPRMPELEGTLLYLKATPEQRQQALELLDAPRALAQVRADTMQSIPDFVEAAGNRPGDGELLRVLRLRARKTLEETARAAGVTISTLSRWERSEVWPDTTRLHALCFALGASEAELAALNCSAGASALLPQTDDLGQIALLGGTLYSQHGWEPPGPLTDLILFGLEAQAWRLLPQQPEAQTMLFALYYWQMKACINTERWEQAMPYVQRVLTLAPIMPHQIEVAPTPGGTFRIESDEAESRALLYQAILAGKRRPASQQHSARRLMENWRTAPDAYLSAWMMSEAAKLLVKSGDHNTAQDWSRQACATADTGDNAHCEVSFRKRDHATILAHSGRGEDALTALETTTTLNSLHPEALARYHMLRTEIYLNLSRPAQAQEEISLARSILQAPQMAYLQPLTAELERRF